MNLIYLFFFEYSHKEATMKLSKRHRQTNSDPQVPGLPTLEECIWVYHNFFPIPTPGVPSTGKWDAVILVSCPAMQPGPVQAWWVHQETPLSRSTDTLTLCCLTSYEVHERSYKKQRDGLDSTLCSLANCPSSRFCAFLHTRTQVDREAYQLSGPSHALTFPFLAFYFLHAYKILPLYSFHLRMAFWLCLTDSSFVSSPVWLTFLF